MTETKPTYKAKPVQKPVPKPKPEPKKYIAKISRMWNPDDERYVLTDKATEMKDTSWLDCQIKAGLIKEV